MLFSKSALFSFTASLVALMGQASAEIVVVPGEVVSRRVLKVDDGHRKLEALTETLYKFPIPDREGVVCNIGDETQPFLQFAFSEDFKPTTFGFEFTTVPVSGIVPPLVLASTDADVLGGKFLANNPSTGDTIPYKFEAGVAGFDLVEPFEGGLSNTRFAAPEFTTLVGKQADHGAGVEWILKVQTNEAAGTPPFKLENLVLDLVCLDDDGNIITNGNIKARGSVVGDPHFTTFGNTHYDFQGACDLVTVENNGYKNGKGMHVHVRTTNYGSWSSTTSAAVKIGDDVLEVHGEDLALINGVEYPVPAIEGSEFNFPMTIGDYSLTVQILGPHTRRHIIHMGDGEKIMINNFKEFVDVEFFGEKAADYDGAVGMLGAFSEGGAMMGRDGTTVFEDADAFGQEWQVRPTDPHLFHIVDGPQYPTKCMMPEAPTAEQRHLRAMAKKVSEDDAKKACANASRKDNCIADVFGSDNLEMANIYTMGSL